MRLRAVRGADDDDRDRRVVSFCGHCGLPPAGGTQASASRVCGQCELGLVLRAASDVAPGPGQPFLVVDATLSVCAVSARAEQLLGIEEAAAVNRHVTDFLVAADANAASPANLLSLLVDVASGSGEPRSVVVRPRREFGVRFAARVGACGPPPAALLVLTS